MTKTALAMADDGDRDDELSLVRERLLERRTRVMFLRNAGATIEAIAKKEGVSTATIRKDLAIVRRDINNEQPTDVIARHRAVVFDIQRANYAAMMKGGTDGKDAAATILKSLAHEMTLLGIAAPSRLVVGPGSLEDFSNEMAELIESIAKLDPTMLKELGRGRIIEADLVEPNHPAGELSPVDPLDAGGGPRGDGDPAGKPDDGEVPQAVVRSEAFHPQGSGGGTIEGGDRVGDRDEQAVPAEDDDLDGWSNI